MLPILLAASVAAKIAIPAFTIDHAPALLGTRVPASYAAAFDAAQCATSVPVTRFGPQTQKALIDCEGNLVCIADVAKFMGAQFVLLGSITRLDDSFTTRLRLLDISEHTVKKTFESHYTGTLKGFDGGPDQVVPEICKLLDPTWVDPAKKVAEQKLAELDFDSGEAKPAKPTPPPTKPDFDLPPLPPDETAAKPAPPAAVAAHAPARPLTPPPGPTVTPKAPPLATTVSAQPVAVAAVPPIDTKVKPQEVTLSPTSERVLGFLPAPRSSQARVGTYVSLGAAGVSTAVAGILGGAALSALSQRSSATNQTDFYAAQSSIESRGLGANVAIGVAGAALLTSAVLWFAGDSIFHDHP